ncbi:UDP-N-acetylmuramate dehydrogenase [bacterium]|nr:UDP-N-acetylmuramate dehydrogenase [bacterium]
MEIKHEKNFNIKKYTTFKIGGDIDKVLFPKSIEEFEQALKETSKVYGNLSNTLVSTFGYQGKIILSTEMNTIKIDGNRVTADCGVKGPKLAQEVCASGLSGLEFMIGFPGSVGGEICMNASAHGQTVSDFLTSVICWSKEFGLVQYSKEEMEFEYRSSKCQRENLIVLQAEFELEKKDIHEIKKQMDENLNFRRKHQPTLALPNCGSIFKNPCNSPAGRLLESVGAKEIMIGDAHVWRNHSNFIINTGNATSMDVLKLMSELQDRVLGEFNIKLEPEIRFLGGFNKEEMKLWQKLNKK